MSKSDRKKERETQQGAAFSGVLDTLYKIWMVIFTILKVIGGAVATVLLIGVVCGFVFMGILGDYLETDILPSASVVLDDYAMDSPSYVYSVNEEGEIELLQELYASTDWKKATYDEIPEALIHSAVAIEDKRFYEHQGVDWITTVKAFANMFFGSETVGGSSITQQLIKNKTGEDSVTVQRKVLEFFRATLLEKNYDKKEIMEEYLNSIYMGQGCRGVKSAAEAYFGKELQMLTVAECASLISITNNPSMFDPYGEEEFMYEGQLMNGSDRNRHRQMLVLGELLSQGYITREEYDEAVAQELVLKSTIAEDDKWTVCANAECGYAGIRSTFLYDGMLICPKCGTAPEIVTNASQEVYSYFVDALLIDVAKDMAQRDGITEWNDDIWENYLDRINRGGYHIYATIDTKVQAQVDKIYKDLDNIPYTRSAQQLQSAITVIDNSTGDIVAMAGGVGDDKVHFGLNRATQSKLQSGSSIKPLSVYAPGFEQGTISPATVIKDLPLQYTNGAWPHNDSRTYSYSRTIYNGVVSSVNAVAAHTLSNIGVTYGYDFAKDNFGLSTLEEADMQHSALALGAQHYGVTVRDMANGFSTFAGNGVYRKARLYTKVYNSKGEIVLDNVQEQKEILSEKTVNYMNYCLTDAVSFGTGTGADFYDVDIAGKTGTTSSNKDKWFCGFTGYYTAAVWCGYDTPETIYLGYNPAASLWKKVMEPLHDGLSNISLYDRSDMVYVSVCLDSGKNATSACSDDVRGDRVKSVLVYPEDIPAGYCDKHVSVEHCSGGGVATEYCKHFAKVDSAVKISQKSLVKMTKSELDEILSASYYGLEKKYVSDDYVYLIDSSGDDANFTGFRGNINADVSAPYKVCTVHTKSAWEDYEKKKAEEEAAKKEPTTGTDTTTTPTRPATTDNGDD